MTNENIDSRKILLGLLISGVVGAGILYSIHATRNHKVPVMKKIGKTISEVGEMIENCNLDGSSDILANAEEKIQTGTDVVNNLVDWLNNGLAVWKTLKKG